MAVPAARRVHTQGTVHRAGVRVRHLLSSISPGTAGLPADQERYPRHRLQRCARLAV